MKSESSADGWLLGRAPLQMQREEAAVRAGGREGEGGREGGREWGRGGKGGVLQALAG